MGLSAYEIEVLRAVETKIAGDLVAGAAFNAAAETLIGSGYMTHLGTLTEKGKLALVEASR